MKLGMAVQEPNSASAPKQITAIVTEIAPIQRMNPFSNP